MKDEYSYIDRTLTHIGSTSNDDMVGYLTDWRIRIEEYKKSASLPMTEWIMVKLLHCWTVRGEMLRKDTLAVRHSFILQSFLDLVNFESCCTNGYNMQNPTTPCLDDEVPILLADRRFVFVKLDLEQLSKSRIADKLLLSGITILQLSTRQYIAKSIHQWFDPEIPRILQPWGSHSWENWKRQAYFTCSHTIEYYSVSCMPNRSVIGWDFKVQATYVCPKEYLQRAGGWDPENVWESSWLAWMP